VKSTFNIVIVSHSQWYERFMHFMYGKIQGVNYIYAQNPDRLSKKLDGIQPDVLIGELFLEENTFFEVLNLVKGINEDCTCILIDESFKTDYVAPLLPQMRIFDSLRHDQLDELNYLLQKLKAQFIRKNFRKRFGWKNSYQKLDAGREVGLLITNRSGKIDWVDNGIVEICGYSNEVMRDQKPGDVLQGPKTSISSILRMREKIKTISPFKTTLINYHGDDHPYWVHLNVIPLLAEDGRKKFLAIQRDVSAQMPALY